MMMKTFIALVLMLPLLFISLVDYSTYKSAGPPACRAGEPPNNITCRTSGCHTSFPLNSGNALLGLDLGEAETNYLPGGNYTITVSLYKPGLMRGGFQLIALQDNNMTISPGTFKMTDKSRTQVIDSAHPHAGQECDIQSKVWIEHTDSSIDDVRNDSISWQIDWQAPETDIGSITFYVASVESNVDLDVTGDYVYSLSKTLLLSTRQNETETENQITIYPNPVLDILYLDYPEITPASKNSNITIINLYGQILLKSELKHLISVNSLPKGLYLIKIQMKDVVQVMPFTKME